MEDQKPRKGLAAMLIASKAPQMEDSEDENVEGQDVAVEDLMMALDERDIEAFKIALNAFIDQR